MISMSERSIDYTGGCLSFTQNFRTFGQNVMDDDWFWLDLFFIIIYDYFAYNTNNDNNIIKQLTDTILQLQKKKKKKKFLCRNASSRNGWNMFFYF